MARIASPIQSYALASAPAISERLVNCFAEPLPPEGRSKAIVRSTHGLTTAYTVGTGPIYAQNGDFIGRTYLVSGSHFWRMRPDDEMAPEDLGDVGAAVTPGSPTSRPAHPTIAVGPYGAMVCAPPNAYYIGHSDAASSLQKLDFTQSASTTGASSVAYIDGYFVFTSGDGTLFFCTELLQPTTFNALYYAKADARGDLVTLVLNILGQLWFFGFVSVTPWQDAGTPFFPFAPVQGVEIEYTVATTRAVVQYNGQAFWVTADGRVVSTSGYEASPISTPAVEEYFARTTSAAYADAFIYSYQGHVHLAITVSSTAETGLFGPRTQVYDLTTKLWHDRTTGLVVNAVYTGLTASIRNGRWMLGDRVNGNLYYPDATVSEEGGAEIVRTMTFPPIWAGGRRASMSLLEIEMEMGASLNAGSMVQLLVSKDGGFTFYGKAETSYGASGVRSGRVRFTRFGSFRQLVLQLIFTDAFVVYGADADIAATGGAALEAGAA